MCSCGASTEFKLRCLENTPFYLYLEHADLTTVAQAFVKRRMKKGMFCLIFFRMCALIHISL